MHSLRLFFLLMFSMKILYAGIIEVDKAEDAFSILSQCQIYLDKDNKFDLQDAIEQKIPFGTIGKNIYPLGFVPNLSTWIRCSFDNTSHDGVTKTLRYNHPFEINIYLYDSARAYKKVVMGDFHRKSSDRFLTHAYTLSFKPGEKKELLLNIVSQELPTIISLELWNPETLAEVEQNRQLILALFFGALGALAIYNFFLFIFTRDKSYGYYTAYALTMLMHQTFYSSMMQLHVIEDMSFTNYFAIYFLIAGPITFSILFMKEFFHLKKHFKKINTFFSLWLLVMYLLIPFGLEDETYGAVIELFILLDTLGIYSIMIVAWYLFFKGAKQAKYIVAGWTIFGLANATMALHEFGITNIYENIPYIVEGAMFIEMILFSIALSARIKSLQNEKQKADALLLEQKESENIRLQAVVAEKTASLTQTLKQKDTLLKEIHHRIKNNLQMITSLLRLQSNTIKDTTTQESFAQAESRIKAMGKVHEILYQQNDIEHIDTQSYLQTLSDELHASYPTPEMIDIHVDGKLVLPMEKAIYLGLIVNELMLNSFKYAFKGQEGDIEITVGREDEEAYLFYRDSGQGFDNEPDAKTLGSRLIKNLAENQLSGNIKKTQADATLMEIRWNV